IQDADPRSGCTVDRAGGECRRHEGRRCEVKRILKWAALVVGVVLVVGLGVFLYLIPPFYMTPPEEFIKQTVDVVPKLDSISDPKERLLAERGRDIVVRTGCNGCPAPI